MFNLTTEELNKIKHEASMRLRRSRRSASKKCRHSCCSTSPVSSATCPTGAQPVPDLSNPPPPGMSLEFWDFLRLRRREPLDDSSKTIAEPTTSPTLTVAVPEISPQMPCGTMHSSLTQDAEEPEQAADDDVETSNDTCASSSEQNATAALVKDITDSVRRWREATADAKLFPPGSIARVAHEAALKAAEGFTMTDTKATTTSSATELTKAKATQMTQLTEAKKTQVTQSAEAKATRVIQLPEGSAAIEMTRLTPMNNEEKAPCVLPIALSSDDSNKENIQLTCNDEDDETEKEFWDSFPKEDKFFSQMVPIGDGNAQVPAYLLKTMNWNGYKIATRRLLRSVFGRRVLATHNLTGKVSPAFPDRTPKGKLDEALVNDIVQTVAERCNVTDSVVRTCITIKCADEGKWLRKQLEKLKQKRKEEEAKNKKAEENNLKNKEPKLKT